MKKWWQDTEIFPFSCTQIISDDSSSQALTRITYIGCGTSIGGLVFTLSVYGFLGRMLWSDRIFIHTNLSISILAAQILFIAGINRVEIKVVCKVIAFFLHLFYLSVFGWMLVEGVHLYMKVVKVYGSENIKVYRYVLIGWVAPVVICLISVAANSEGYGTDRSCWLDTTSGAIWAFVAPALLVIMFNMLVLAMVVRIVVNSTKLHREKQYDHIKMHMTSHLRFREEMASREIQSVSIGIRTISKFLLFWGTSVDFAQRTAYYSKVLNSI